MTHPIEASTVQAIDAAPYPGESKLAFLPLECSIKASNLTCLVGPHRFQLRAYLHMLAGITKPKQGRVEILGKVASELEQSEWRALRAQIGYVSGAAPLLSVQHGLMNVMLPLLYHSDLSFRETASKARALLDQLHCHFDPTLFPAMLNSFHRSQLALARALILDPPVLFLDVPFHDLGAKQREKMAVLLGEHKSNRAVCMIGGLQYTHFLEQHATQIIFISDRKIINFNGWDAFMHSEDQDVKDLLSVLQN